MRNSLNFDKQNVALFNGINTYETTLFCTFGFCLIPKSGFGVFIADFYMVLHNHTPVMLVTANVALF